MCIRDRPCTVLTIDIGEDRRREIVRRFHENRAEREEVETKLAAAAGLEPHEVIIYCPSFGMSLPEAEVQVRMEGAQLLPLSGSNNEEIRILKEKHKALWKFYVLVDRAALEKSSVVANAASEILGEN